MDINNLYLNTPMLWYEYVRIKISGTPDEVVAQYKLKEKVNSNGYIYIEVKIRMYGLPQSGMVAQQLLEQRLHKNGFSQSKAVPRLWTHNMWPISLTSVVDDFGIKYVGEEHAEYSWIYIK